MDKIFPSADSENQAIYVPGVGSTKPFSVLMVDSMPDLHFVNFWSVLPALSF